MKIKKLLDFRQGEADFVVATDELYAVQMTLAVIAIPGGGSRRRREQLLPFVEPNCLYIYACATSKFSNLHSEIIHPILRYKARG